MKILLIVPEYPPHHIGGGGVVFEKLAVNFRNLGYEVMVVYGYYASTSWFQEIREYEKDGIKFIEVPEIPYPKKIKYLRTVMPTPFWNSGKLDRIIKLFHPDVAHLHGYGLSFILQGAKVCVKNNIPYAFTLHGYPATQEQKNVFIKTAYGIYERMFTFVCENASIITGVSDFITLDKRLDAYNGKRITVMNGIDAEEYSCAEAIDIRNDLKIPANAVIIFSMGRISRMKGFQEIVKILPELQEKTQKNIYYLIAGEDDGYKEDLIQIIKNYKLEDKVIFLGYKQKQEIINLLHSCDVFSIPSLWDPCPIAAYEGMAVGKYILTTEAGGIKDILRNYHFKLNIYTQTHDIVQLLEKENYKNPIEVDLSSMSWKNIAKKYLSVLEGCIKKDI